MPTGIDLGGRSAVVATQTGMRRHDRAVAALADGNGTDDGDGRGNGASAGDGTGPVRSGPAGVGTPGANGTTPAGGATAGGVPGRPPDLVGAPAVEAAERLLEAAAAGPDEGPLRYVAPFGGPDRVGGAALGEAATRLGYDAATLDPGMAVLYDDADAGSAPTGLGVAVYGDGLVGTLAVAGVPVARAVVDCSADWYTHGDGGGNGVETDGPVDWFTVQYEGPFAELAGRLDGAPALVEAVPVAVGGEAAPVGAPDRVGAALSAVPFDVESVSVANSPGNAVVRGALWAAAADGGEDGAVPAFAVDAPYEAGLADVAAAAAGLGEGATARQASDGTATATAAGPGEGGTADPAPAEDLGTALQRVRSDLTALDRRGATASKGLSELARQVEAIEARSADDTTIESLRESLSTVESELDGKAEADTVESTTRALERNLDTVESDVAAVETALEALAEESGAGIRAVRRAEDLTASLASLGEAVARLDGETDSLREMLSAPGGAPGGDGDGGGGASTARLNALREDVEAMETDLTERLEYVESDLEAVTDDVVDLQAAAEDVDDVEGRLEATRETVVTLTEDVDELRAAVQTLQEDVSLVETTAATTDDLDTLHDIVGRIGEDVEDLEERVENEETAAGEDIADLRATVEEIQDRLVARKSRVETLEDELVTLDERIETIYQNSAKSEALSSLQAEVRRAREMAADTAETGERLDSEVEALRSTVSDQNDRLSALSTDVDNISSNAVSRPELVSTIENVEDRIDDAEDDLRADIESLREDMEERVEREEEDDEESTVGVAVSSLAFGLVIVGLLGAFQAWNAQFVGIAVVSVLVPVLSGFIAWLFS